MSSIINSFFCSISAFFFNNIITFLLFGLLAYMLYYIVIRKLNKLSKILYFIFIVLVFASGIVLVLLPGKENVMSSCVVNSYYFGPVELVTIILLFISMFLRKSDEKAYSISNSDNSSIKLDNIEKKERKIKKKEVKEGQSKVVKKVKKTTTKKKNVKSKSKER